MHCAIFLCIILQNFDIGSKLSLTINTIFVNDDNRLSQMLISLSNNAVTFLSLACPDDLFLNLVLFISVHRSDFHILEFVA